MESEEERIKQDAADLINELLETHGVEKQELAERLGLKKSAVTHIVSGKRNLTLTTLSNVCNALGYRLYLDATRVKK